jgi:hypothetical protein
MKMAAMVFTIMLPLARSSRDGIDVLTLLFSFVLTIVGIAGVLAAYRSLKAIEAQGKIMQGQLEQATASAKAALLNARTAINSERPWIVVNPSTGAGNPFLHRFEAWNYGRTPAEIIRFHATLNYVKDETEIPILTPNGEFRFVHKVLLLPVQQVSELRNAPLEGSAKAQYDVYSANIQELLRKAGRQMDQEVGMGKKLVVVYGIVVYADVLTKDEHYTRFCYRWHSQNKRMILAGPEGANEHT